MSAVAAAAPVSRHSQAARERTEEAAENCTPGAANQWSTNWPRPATEAAPAAESPRRVAVAMPSQSQAAGASVHWRLLSARNCRRL